MYLFFRVLLLKIRNPFFVSPTLMDTLLKTLIDHSSYKRVLPQLPACNARLIDFVIILVVVVGAWEISK